MVHKLIMVGTVLLAVGSIGSTAAAATGDDMRCEALGIRQEVRRLGCLGRCLNRASRKEARQSGAGEAFLDECGQTCDDRYAAAMARLKQRPVCTPEPADPQKCAAELLGAEARSLLCKSRCERRAARSEEFDREGCYDDCEVYWHTAEDEILATSVCADGAAALE